MTLQVGDVLRRGETLGTIGDAHGIYASHLHFEMRDQMGMGPGAGYGADPQAYLDPTAFILAHRPPPERSELPATPSNWVAPPTKTAPNPAPVTVESPD